MSSKARNLARLIVDASGDVDSSALSNVPASDDASALTTGTLPIARIADGAVTAAKLASGAAASNLGNYVTSVNGSTGAVTVDAASTAFGGIGSYTAAYSPSTVAINGGTLAAGTTVAGSGLRQTLTGRDLGGISTTTAALSQVVGLSGTWRLMMNIQNSSDSAARHVGGLWVRIS
jgi:hypothetical protein